MQYRWQSKEYRNFKQRYFKITKSRRNMRNISLKLRKKNNIDLQNTIRNSILFKVTIKIQ